VKVDPLPSCTAMAAQGRQVYAMVAVGGDEALTDILDRLDAAVEKALDDGTITDEIHRWSTGKSVIAGLALECDVRRL